MNDIYRRRILARALGTAILIVAMTAAWTVFLAGCFEVSAR